ncbi:RNA helicase [Vibrio cholerae]|nr:RNA helicase [Vibrio cholerae]
MSFSQLGLSDVLVQTVAQLGYQKPTHIQTQAIPVILQGRDLIAAAQTGTGKTASFVLPILEKLRQGQTQRKKTCPRLDFSANPRACDASGGKSRAIR